MGIETEADRALYLEVYGETAIYTPVGGLATPLTAVIDRGDTEVRGSGQLGASVRARQAWLSQDDVPLKPPAESALVADGVTYAIKNAESDIVAGFWLCTLRVT